MDSKDSALKHVGTSGLVLDSLGGVGKMVPTWPALERFVRYTNTYAGSDKVLTVIQYIAKLLIPFLEWRAQMQHKYGKRAEPSSPAAAKLAKFAGIIGDSQMVWRLLGLPGMMSWAASIEKNPNPNPRFLAIERLQALSMLIFYPLDNLFFFGKHNLIPISPKNMQRLGLWSTRAWLAFVGLRLLRLYEQVTMLKEKGKQLRQQKREQTEKNAVSTSNTLSDDELAAEIRAIQDTRAKLFVDWISNLAYFPHALHWSLESGVFGNQLIVTILGAIANITSLKNAFDATP